MNQVIKSVHKLPQELLNAILLEVVLDTGENAYFTLSVVCWKFRDNVSLDIFQEKAHFLWLLSKIYIIFKVIFKKLILSLF